MTDQTLRDFRVPLPSTERTSSEVGSKTNRKQEGTGGKSSRLCLGGGQKNPDSVGICPYILITSQRNEEFVCD